MAHSYKFAIVRISPDSVRDERVNVGVVVFRKDGLDVRFAARLQKIRAISGILSLADIEAAGAYLAKIDELGARDATPEARYGAIKRFGPFALSVPGEFLAHNEKSYEERISSIIQHYVDAEVPSRIQRAKRSRLFTVVKQAFRQERVLAKKNEGLDSHRIVPGLEIADGLIADLALKNGSMHIVETVDASLGIEGLKRAIADLGVSGLVLERAKMKFGAGTSAQLVYSASTTMEPHVAPSLEAIQHQGVTVYNWASTADQSAFVTRLSQLAQPHEGRTRKGRQRLTA